MTIEATTAAGTAGPVCGHSACSQHYIDTGATWCVKQETWFCAKCGSLDIRHDATVTWNPDRHDWDVEAVHDGQWCEGCRDKDPDDDGEPVFGIPGDENATDSMIGGGA